MRAGAGVLILIPAIPNSTHNRKTVGTRRDERDESKWSGQSRSHRKQQSVLGPVWGVQGKEELYSVSRVQRAVKCVVFAQLAICH